MDHTPRADYEDRLAQRRQALRAVDTQLHRIHLLRLVVFAIAALLIWQAIRGALSIWWIVIPVVLFIALVWKQSRYEREGDLIRRATAFYERGIARIEHKWQGVGSTGERFADAKHPYSADLDLFGRASLFQLLSIARTGGGEARLAAWLTSAPTSLRDD